MSNKKVYLAKHILASGFDVEYVKSSLLRIPGIDIVETGMGIEPKECVSFVIVPQDGVAENEESAMYLSKNITKDLKDYYKSHNGENTVYIFGGVMDSTDSCDAEKEEILFFQPTDEDILIEDKDNFNNHASLDLMEGEEFLYNISVDIGASNFNDWKDNPRHPQPKAEYALPPLPTLEERRLKKSTAIMDEAGHWEPAKSVVRS